MFVDVIADGSHLFAWFVVGWLHIPFADLCEMELTWDADEDEDDEYEYL